jgi:hypothetical protein
VLLEARTAIESTVTKMLAAPTEQLNPGGTTEGRAHGTWVAVVVISMLVMLGLPVGGIADPLVYATRAGDEPPLSLSA